MSVPVTHVIRAEISSWVWLSCIATVTPDRISYLLNTLAGISFNWRESYSTMLYVEIQSPLGRFKGLQLLCCFNILSSFFQYTRKIQTCF